MVLSRSWSVESLSALLCRSCALLGGALCILMGFAIVASVVSRFLFNSPIHGVDTVVIVVTPLVFAMGLGYAQVSGSHIRVEFFVSHLKQGPQRVIRTVVLVLSILVTALVTWLLLGSAITAWSFKEIIPGLVEVPVYPTKMLLFFGFALWCLQHVVELFRILKGKGSNAT